MALENGRQAGADILALRGVDALYGDSHVLHDVSFAVKPGRVLALLGRNGAGKTTCMNAIIGFLKPRKGEILLQGESIGGLSPETISRRGVGLVPQGRRIFASLSVYENLCIGLPGKADAGREDYVFERFPKLKQRLKQAGGTLSGGEQQMLAIARCLMMKPKLIILDEPTEGIAPRLVSDIRREIHLINKAGISILLVEQNVQTAYKLCQRVIIMEKGAVVHSAASHELKAHPEVVHRYLGLSF